MAAVEIYTKFFCSYCARAKKLLDAKNVGYSEYEISAGGEMRAEMIQRSHGRTTVPQIFINGRHVGGCDDLMALEREGELDRIFDADDNL
jgi:glutaredoxin 3